MSEKSKIYKKAVKAFLQIQISLKDISDQFDLCQNDTENDEAENLELMNEMLEKLQEVQKIIS